MKTSKLVVIGVSVFAGLMAFMLRGGPPKTVIQQAAAPAAPEIQTTEVLVAKVDLGMGTAITENEISWVKWPMELAASALIQKSARPNAIEEFKGSITRQPFFANEPIREEKLIKGNGSGFLSAILPSGKRAIAISIDSRGATSAGGFILPNDHVDVIVTKRDAEGSTKTGSEVYQSATLLTRIRVLAIGQNVQEKNGERVVVGETATLELDPSQSEQIILAQRTGTLALALRSMVDHNKLDEPRAKAANGSVTIVRYGVGQEINK